MYRKGEGKQFLLKTTAPDHFSYNYISTSTPRFLSYFFMAFV